MEPKWVTRMMVEAIHSESITLFGGATGVRDTGLLESALDRPKNLFAYEEAPTIFQLAAMYCVGLIRNHPFVDGNKRVGLLTANAFLSLNGYDFRPREADAATLIIALASGTLDEAALAAWFSDFSTAK
ncbi:MAG: type II toxin-antitoxin system death-on-curing family toxin [Rhodospirillales bacterium]|nr:type II toxin-antitoxin system death-on-curing family toxin [Rhodospirillales bacterium]